MRVAVIGAGFSGVAVATQLLKLLPAGSRLHLINRSGSMGRGLAYGTRSNEHLLNVPAARMGIDPADTDSFLTWLRSRGDQPWPEPHNFVARRLYGEYLQDVLNSARASRPDIAVTQLHAHAKRISGEASRGFHVDVDEQDPIDADRIVLSLGNFSPAIPHPDLLALARPRFVNDPWNPDTFEGLDGDEPVALIGTGLTMLDMLVSLEHRGHRGPVLALSRRGLVPQSHRENEMPPPNWHPPESWLAAPLSLRSRLVDVRRFVADAELVGQNWRDIWGGLRTHTPRLWEAMSLNQRRQFLRHLQVYWDTHRHRAAPKAHLTMNRMLGTRQLEIHAGRLLSVECAHDTLTLSWQPRHQTHSRRFYAAKAINCSGPSSAISKTNCELLWHLQQEQRLLPCPLGLGLQVDNKHRLLGGDGRPQQGLFYIGPMLKAQFWESTAVPELRQHAYEVAKACYADQ